MIVRLINLPTTVRGTTVPDEDGNYNVYLNKNLSYEMQRETFEHETMHVNNGDFESNETVRCLEEKARYKSLRFGHA